MTRVPAADLRPGDVVHYNPRCSWRVQTVTRSGRSVRITGVYVRWDFDDGSDRTGHRVDHRFRATTSLTVTRPEGTTPA